VVDAALANWRTAPVRPEARAALGFLETLIRTGAVSPDDVAAAYAAGVTRDGLLRAVEICALFSIIVRLADTFGFARLSPAGFAASARMLLRRGYVL
jgi:alkylhydroperoxidase family enzyme